MKSQYIRFITLVTVTTLSFIVVPKFSFAQEKRTSSPTSGSSASPTFRSPSSTTSEIVYTPPQNFFCDVKDMKNDKGEVVKKNVPMTMAQTAKGEVVTYFWTKSFYVDSGESSLTRCTRVAQVLSQVIEQDMKNWIEHGHRMREAQRLNPPPISEKFRQLRYERKANKQVNDTEISD
ncbi:MAG: COP23 domain-containing protein [Scytonema sp. PMC 1069.18]|nr:COP23 domain-containing protein [Scytonema sp. PMC 1069.18]MEC4882991.1 COP23 domain-containing protein [Scytonema sp. PMC 1070.18]